MHRLRGKGLTVALSACLCALGLPAGPPAVAQTLEADAVPTRPQPVITAPTGHFQGAERRSQEIVSLRTQSSKSYQNEFGAYETVLHGGSIHYRNPQGQWADIDNSMVQDGTAGYRFRNQANRYETHLPPGIGNAPVRFELDNDWVSFRLNGAQGAGASSGSTVSYTDVLPGVDVRFTALNDALKEELILKSPDATASFGYDLKTSPSLTPRTNEAGGIDFLDSAGSVEFSLASPVAFDSASPEAAYAPPSAYSLTTVPGGYELRVAIDPNWLRAPERVFPVTLDPTVGFLKDCYIANAGLANTTLCADNHLDVGYNGTNKKRALIKFDYSDFPDNAEILNADLALYQHNASSTQSADVSLRPATEGWNQEATWNRRVIGANWETAGGSFDSSKGYKAPSVSGSAVNEWKHWYPTQLVKDYISGTQTNLGLLLKQENESVNVVLNFRSSKYSNQAFHPQMTVTWDHGGMGRFPTYKVENQRLSDKMSIHANVAGGNLLVENNDFQIPGTGLDLTFDRYYNNLLQTNFLDTNGAFGTGWTMSTGADIGLEIFSDGSVAYFGSSGYRLAFTRNPFTGDFRTPPGLNAKLIKETDGSYTLRFFQTEEKMLFSSTGRLTAHRDKNGNELAFSYTGNQLTSIVDTQGRSTTFTYLPGSGLIDVITDPAGRDYTYTYNQGRLATFTDPTGAVTRYDYDAANNLVKITDPELNETHFTYNADRWVTSIKRVTGTGNPPPGDVTGFDYTAAPPDPCPDSATQTTKVTDARGNATHYCFNPLSRVEQVTNAEGNLTSLRYNSRANVESYTDELGHTTTFAYDSAGDNLVSTEAPQNAGSSAPAVTTTEYSDLDHKGLPTATVTAEGSRTVYDYDAEGNLVEVIKAPGSLDISFIYDYNPDGTLARIDAPPEESDPNVQGNDTTFFYDALGNLEQIVYPQPLGDVGFTYDLDLSRMETMTDGEDQTTTLSYDDADRLLSAAYDGGDGVGLTYDDAGNLLTRTDTSGQTSKVTQFAYNSKNLLEQRTDPDATTTTYDYNPVGSLSKISGPGGDVTYTYDDVNLVDLITDASGAVDIDHGVRGNRTATEYPNGVVMHHKYFAAGQLERTWVDVPTQPTAPELFDQNYSYSSAGTLKDVGLLQKTTDNRLGDVITYDYDAMGRLENATTTSGQSVVRSFDYTYDDNSNRLTETTLSDTTTFTYNDANQLVSKDSTTYSYDGNGSETSNSAGRAMTYDSKNHTTSVTPEGGSAVAMTYSGTTQFERPTKGTTTFSYNPLGVYRDNTGST
jgi:YD repeat-containing protein